MFDDDLDLSRRDLLRAAGAGAALGVLPAGLAAAQSSRPNVVVVVIDSLRTDHVGAYGGRRARTPNLDAFGRQSLRFTNARPEAMPTIPARRAMWTGKRSYPFRGWHPVKGLPGQPGWQPISRNQVTLPTLLNRAGFHTSYVTDNPHLLLRPFDSFRRRFDDRPGVVGQVPLRRHVGNKYGNGYTNRWWPAELRDEPGRGRIREYLTVNKARQRDSEDDYLAAKVFGTGIRALDRAARKQPFALIVDSFDVHEPWDPPPAYRRLYGLGPSGGPIQPFATPAGRTRDLRSGTERRARALYAAEVTFVDAWFGNLMNRLTQLGLAGNTWVVVLSDHGVLLGEYGMFGKPNSYLHREMWDVPFMIRDPQGRLAGQRSRYFASTHDVTPTVLGAVGLRKARGMTGQDLTSFFDGKRPRRRPYWTTALNDYVAAGDERWLLVCHNQGGDVHLYDRKRDPRERRNVASRNPRQVRRMKNWLREDAGGPLPRFD